MIVVIAEKNELAKAIVEGLGGGTRKQGYYDCGSHLVVPCVGHMLELLEPEDYDERYKVWRAEDLPWCEIPWKKKPIERTQEQLNVILRLIDQADSIVHAGDPDDEGQLIVDEILEYAGCRKPVQRVLINDNNTKVVQRALANMRDNAEFRGLSASAEARSVGDLLYGVNLTRMYTLMAKKKGYPGVLHAGRVSSAITGLVVRRDRANEGHSATNYFVVKGSFAFGGICFDAAYQPTERDTIDDKSRLSDRAQAESIAGQVNGQSAVLASAVTKELATPAPLPYNLLRLQADAARRFGMKPDEVMAVSQSLKDKHRAITYNRTDTEYLSDEQHEEAPEVLAAVAATAPTLARAVELADPKLKSRAFNSAKVTVHHGIVPTQAKSDIATFTQQEKQIYLLIAVAYVAQFHPLSLTDKTRLELTCADRRFVCEGRVVTRPGWTALYGGDASSAEEAEDDASLDADLRQLVTGQDGSCTGAAVLAKATQPPPLYNIASLLTDLTRAAKYVKNDRLRQALLERDKDKEGENGGIGTPATRDTHLKNLFERGYLAEKKVGKKSYVVSTPKAREYYDALPDQAKFPDMTAIWVEQLKGVEAGQASMTSFIDGLMDYIRQEMARVQADGINVASQLVPCPKCKSGMLRIRGGDSFFWACSQREACGHTMNDKNGQPVPKAAPSALHKCMSCGLGLVRRESPKKGRDPARAWWGCSGFKDGCKQTYPDLKGKPNYGVTKKVTA